MKSPVDADEIQAAAAEADAEARGPEPIDRGERREPGSAAPSAGVGVDVVLRELRETQAEVRRLRAFLSHGLRQPMAALTIWAELLNAKQAAALDEQGRRYLRELTASVHRIAAMLSSEMQASALNATEGRPSDEPPPSARPASKREDG